MRAFGDALKTIFKDHALVSRLGGDEFVVVLEGKEVLNPCTEEISILLSQHRELYIKQLSFSSGIAVRNGFESTEQLYQQADQ
ncbi:hypothetical protein GCM10012290_17090 [Halolactibacillus alkaliphilus]|uniref:GGDEF domain-containing protein n=1 Tax=Halolactibacillus alkaliphilus TaxID=442899 RepID=A0A511X5C4_9BACI|nr:hypothetical protein HAL01_25790 [Halolactibacillus alkaliphilus]GGN71769.1 hypothetical protein GCM10012290_17090 [Halolactibacillus alkaliphilus]SFO85347.1 Diguanylate cyclase, GGDEF domain [Halolactibacillus alkaliphilus]